MVICWFYIERIFKYICTAVITWSKLTNLNLRECTTINVKLLNALRGFICLKVYQRLLKRTVKCMFTDVLRHQWRVWRYVSHCPSGTRIVKLRCFQNLWTTYCPYIITTKPAYDLCDLCRELPIKTKSTPYSCGGSNKPIVCWKDFDWYFSTKYTSLTGISKYHHFTFTKNEAILCKKLVASEQVSISIHELGTNVTFTDEPNVTAPPGLPLKRQFYLFNQVRNLCANESNKDEVAPIDTRPIEELEDSDSDAVDDSEAPASSNSVQKRKTSIPKKVKEKNLKQKSKRQRKQWFYISSLNLLFRILVFFSFFRTLLFIFEE